MAKPANTATTESTPLSYHTIAIMAEDYDLQKRITACAFQEKKPDALSWAHPHMWQIAISPGWAAAWNSAIAAKKENIGKLPDVITDAMILSVVQPMT